ncbi:MAG: glycosyltransferase [bacterium]|nr:glycosyltransferase [bacterium]
MKISINSKFLTGPYGGGMQFANYMRSFLEEKGVIVVNNLKDDDIDIILHVNPFPNLTPQASSYSFLDAYRYKTRHSQTVIIERVNECDERKGTQHMNKHLVQAAEKSDFVVFIASWLRPLLLKNGMEEDKPYRVILNGADQKIFNTQNKEFWNGQGKLKIVTHHWSDNPKKGHDIYQKLDELLNENKFREAFEFTYIGRVPENMQYKNTRIIPSLAGRELADELKKHHVYITASENEPGGMHHIEGALSGLPPLYINSGALPEYCEGFGIEFNGNNLKEKILEMRGRYFELIKKLESYENTAEKMANEYLKLFKELSSKEPRKRERARKYVPKMMKYPLMVVYILYRSITRGTMAKKITLNLAGVLPPPNSKDIVHGGKVKLLALRERFGDSWKHFNIAYFVSSGLPFAPALWLYIYKLFGIKTVWNQNGVAYPAWAGERTDSVNGLMNPMHMAQYVIYQTEFTKKCADKFLGIYKGSSEILINPVDTNKFVPRQIPMSEEPFVVIMSGHHFESKERLDISLEAVRELKRRGVDAKLMVIGNTQELPKEEWLEEIGKFSQEEAPGLYHKAHVLLHLKNLDPCPTFVLEALSCGLPVIGLANGGMPELVDEKSGILVPAPENFDKFQYPAPDEIAQAIMKVRDDLPEFSLNARNQALKFDKEIWLEKHREIFEKLCQKSR